jgi:hypothetical protein
LHAAFELPQIPSPLHDPLQQSFGPEHGLPTSAQVLPSSPCPSLVPVDPVHAPSTAPIEPNVIAQSRAFFIVVLPLGESPSQRVYRDGRRDFESRVGRLRRGPGTPTWIGVKP